MNVITNDRNDPIDLISTPRTITTITPRQEEHT